MLDVTDILTNTTDSRTSEDAKKHAREILEAAGVHFDAAEGVVAAEHEKRVIAGYKAALHSECDPPVAVIAAHDIYIYNLDPRVSEEAKQHAKEYLKEHNVQ